jgi:NDP-sugar pyrophosphorylase family protein
VPLTDAPGTTTAAILCGGLGTRLRPVAGDTPKALVEIAGTPFLDRLLAHLAASGLHDVVLCTGVGADRVAAHCGDGSRWGLEIRSSREDTPLGTGGALRLARGLIASSPFLVLNGDSFVDADPRALVSFHTARRAGATLLLVRVPDRSRFGSVRLGDGGRIAAFEEKGLAGPGLVNAGVYALSRNVLDAIPAGRPVSLESEVFPALVGGGLFGFVAHARFIDIGTPESFREAGRFFA